MRASLPVLLLVAAAGVALSGCAATLNALGMGKHPPDEFVVVTHPPLQVPANFDLVPPQMIADLPIRNVRPDRLSDDIAAALDRRSEWRDWSSQSRRFVEKWHDPHLIAAAMIDLYRDARGPFTLPDQIAAAATAAEAVPQ